MEIKFIKKQVVAINLYRDIANVKNKNKSTYILNYVLILQMRFVIDSQDFVINDNTKAA